MDWESQYEWQREDEVREWAARYLEVGPRQIALTGSTTEGLAMIYGGLKVGAGQEVLITEHEHYCAQKALEFRNQRQGTAVRQIRLFDDPWTVSTDQVLSTLDKAIKPNTRVLGMTWVHSGSGVKLPVGEIGELVRRHNRERSEAERILYVVDGAWLRRGERPLRRLQLRLLHRRYAVDVRPARHRDHLRCLHRHAAPGAQRRHLLPR